MSTQQTAETIVGAVDDLEYTVLARTSHTPNIIELELAPADERLSHQSGQYVLIGDPDHTVPVRSYSLANAPSPWGADQRAGHRGPWRSDEHLAPPRTADRGPWPRVGTPRHLRG